MIWSMHCGCGIHCDIVNPKLIELEAAKELLAEVYDIQIWGADGPIQQYIVDFRLTGMESDLYHAARQN